MEIETLARESPEKIFTLKVHPLRGLAFFQARELAYRLTEDKTLAGELAKIVYALYKDICNPQPKYDKAPLVNVAVGY